MILDVTEVQLLLYYSDEDSRSVMLLQKKKNIK